MIAGDVTSPHVPPGPGRPKSQAVENFLRVLGVVCDYGHKPPALGRRPAVWGHTHKTREGSARVIAETRMAQRTRPISRQSRRDPYTVTEKKGMKT